MTFTIEKDKPIQPASKRAGRPYRYPVGELAVGESFLVSAEDYSKAKASAAREGRLNNKRFDYGKDVEDETKYRIVRVG